MDKNNYENEKKQKRERPAYWPDWFTGKTVLEDVFCDELLRDYPMKSVNGSFYTADGKLFDESVLERRILERISPYIQVNVGKKVSTLLHALRLFCGVSDLPVHTDRIHTANGTYFCPAPGMEFFREEREICRNRLPVSYNPEAPEPVRWKKFLSELLYEEDIPTLQEFMGYCFLPTTKAQKMLLIIGKGGEGKSRIGLVLRHLLGENMSVGSIGKLESNRFSRADLEHRLLLLDDDMQMEGLASTNYLKTIVTSETAMDLEKKGKQSYQGILYARMIGLGNGSLYALYDRSVGFFRRQIILRTKERDPGRTDDPCLAEKLREESEGIFLWCLEGLTRLQKRNYRFTVSVRAAKNLNESVREGNNIIDFLSSQGYIRFHPEAKVPSKELYAVYKGWCEDNTVVPVCAKFFTGYLKEEQTMFGIAYDNNVPLVNGRRARGFHGIECARLGRFETEVGE